MVKVIISVDASRIDIDSKMDAFKDNVLDELSMNTKKIIERNTPVEKGTARNNYRLNKSENQHSITNNLKYLPWVNDGTGIYGSLHRRITPKHAKVLHFQWKGKEWFLKSVRGQKGQKFVERTMDEVKSEIESMVVRAANKTFK